MSPTQPQQPPVAGVAPHSVDLVVADFEERKRYGVEKYGVPHQWDNGRDHLVDLYQELLDACVYVRAELGLTRDLRVELNAQDARLVEQRLVIDELEHERASLLVELEQERRELARLREQLAEASR